MTVAQAHVRMAQPLKFGDPEQIKAVKVLEDFEDARRLYRKMAGQPHCAVMSDDELMEILPVLREFGGER